MARSTLSCVAVFLVICLYFAPSLVYSETTTEFPVCPFGMQTGDVKYIKPCAKCECEEGGMACKGCPASDPVPANCVATPEKGDWPKCCQKIITCP